MKKTLFTAVITLLAFYNLNAQDKGDFELGSGLGISLSNVTGNDKTLTSFNASLSGEHYFSDRWGIKIKLTYDNKGWADGFYMDEFFVNTTTDYKLSYITIPVMANWHFGRNRNWYLNFGPYIGTLLSAKALNLNLDVKEGFRNSDIGLALGIGYKFEINETTRFYIEYDSQSGYSEIFKENSGDPIKNIRAGLNVGVLFNL